MFQVYGWFHSKPSGEKVCAILTHNRGKRLFWEGVLA